MKNKKNNMKSILIIEGVFLLGVLFYIFFLTIPSNHNPVSGMSIIEPDWIFEIEKGEQIILSVDENFTKPIILDEGSEIELSPGKYYWKTKNLFRESEVKTFVIEGKVALEIGIGEFGNELNNVGNVDIKVTERGENLTEEFYLDEGDSKNIGNSSLIYEGEQK